MYILTSVSIYVTGIFKIFMGRKIERLRAYLFFFYYIVNHNSCRVFEEENDVIARDLNKEENSKSVVPAAASLENLGKTLKLLKHQNGISA